VTLGTNVGWWRCLLVWSLASLALGLTALVTGGPACALVREVRDGRLAGAALDVAVADLAAALLLGCATWMWLVVSLVVVEATRGGSRRTQRPRVVPAGVRRVVLAACGVALAGALPQPSYADPLHGDRHQTHHRTRLGLAGLPLPDRAVAPPRRTGALPSAPGVAAVVVVRPGDTLWSIATRGMPRDSTDSGIAARWRDIYAANRSLIGPDPDLIVPGQRLVLPRKEPR
jgi:hypothetical protein